MFDNALIKELHSYLEDHGHIISPAIMESIVRRHQRTTEPVSGDPDVWKKLDEISSSIPAEELSKHPPTRGGEPINEQPDDCAYCRGMRHIQIDDDPVHSCPKCSQPNENTGGASDSARHNPAGQAIAAGTDQSDHIGGVTTMIGKPDEDAIRALLKDVYFHKASTAFALSVLMPFIRLPERESSSPELPHTGIWSWNKEGNELVLISAYLGGYWTVDEVNRNALRKPSVLVKHQPCGCVICTCESDDQCSGCGAKYCGKHPVGELPEGGLWTFGDETEEQGRRG